MFNIKTIAIGSAGLALTLAAAAPAAAQNYYPPNNGGGIVGAILSVPLTAVAWTAWKIIMEPDEEEPEPPASSPVEPVKRAARGLTAKLTGRPSASSAS